jgi:hypothetical protein
LSRETRLHDTGRWRLGGDGSRCMSLVLPCIGGGGGRRLPTLCAGVVDSSVASFEATAGRANSRDRAITSDNAQ